MTGIAFYIKAFITLLALLNPREGIPIFLARTQRSDALR